MRTRYWLTCALVLPALLTYGCGRIGFEPLRPGAPLDAGTLDAGTLDAGALEPPCDPGDCPVLRVVRSIGSNNREFSTIAAWETARGGDLVGRRVLRVMEAQGTFMPGETVLGGGCSGRYIPGNEALLNEPLMFLDNFSGACQPGEGLMGDASGARATHDALVAIGTIEVGELYADSVFIEHVVIDGSTTDAAHHLVLSVAETDRHRGLPGTGAVIDPPPPAGHAIYILDDYTVVEWIEVTDWSDATDGGSFDGINIAADQVVVEGAMVYRDGRGSAGDTDAGGIQLDAAGMSATVRNSLVFDIARVGIGIHFTQGATLTVENSTVVDCLQADSLSPNYGCIGFGASNEGSVMHVRNSVAVGGVVAFRTGGGGSFGTVGFNLSSDDTAPGAFSLLDLTPGAVFTDSGQSDYHLRPGSPAAEAGIDLSGSFAGDIDGDIRPQGGQWDIGADELAP